MGVLWVARSTRFSQQLLPLIEPIEDRGPSRGKMRFSSGDFWLIIQQIKKKKEENFRFLPLLYACVAGTSHSSKDDLLMANTPE